MTKILGYVRVSTDKQDLNNQKLEILEYCRIHNLNVSEYIEVTVSSRKNSGDRRVDELMAKLVAGDILIITELSRLGRSTSGIISIVNTLIAHKIRLIVIKQNLNIREHDMNSKIITAIFSLMAELERDLISLRTKEALASKKASGIILGKKRGTIQKSRYDKDVGRIKELLNLGLSVRKIAKLLNVNNHISLNTYINKRNLHQKLQK